LELRCVLTEPSRPLPGWPCDFQPDGTNCTSSDVQQRRSDVSPVQGIAAAQSQLRTVVNFARQAGGHELGLPGRDLLYPKYAIHNKAAYLDSWNAAEGGISNKTVNTDVMHQNGLAMYDTYVLPERFVAQFSKSYFSPIVTDTTCTAP
jgi:alpha-glucosidase